MVKTMDAYTMISWVVMATTKEKNLEKTSKGETTDLLKLNCANIVGLGEVQFCNLASKLT